MAGDGAATLSGVTGTQSRSVFRRSPPWGRALLMVLAAALAAPARSADQAPAFVHGVGDRLLVSVFDRPELSGEVRIRPPGVLSLPVAGVIEAAGLPTRALEQAIAGALVAHDAKSRPWVTVEILEYRPFFVVGDVREPGAYPWVPEMTVLHALALGGGQRRIGDEGTLASFEIARTRERYRQLEESLGVALALHARLQAELDGAERIEFPANLADYLEPGKREATVASERRLLHDRRAALAGEVEVIEEAKATFRKEIAARRSQLRAEEERRKLIDDEIAELSSPLGARLVPKNQILSLRRLKASIEGDHYELQSLRARAQQRIDDLDREALRLRNLRRLEISAGLKAASDEITQVRIGLQETGEALAQAGHGVRRRSGSGSPAVLRRRTSTGWDVLEVDLDAPVLPGDVVEIRSARDDGS